MQRALIAVAPLWLLLSCSSEVETTSAPSMLDAVTFYASFDESVAADFSSGPAEVRTRYGALNNPDGFRYQDGYPQNAYRIAPSGGVNGGALEALDVLPENGRMFFPAAGNLPYDRDGWSGSVSFWIKTNPDTMLKTSFCDPIQITQRGATNGGLWIDFPDSSPRDMRLGAFQSEGDGRERIFESDPEAPLIVVSPIGFQQTDWHHLLFTWSDFDTGADNAQATLYIDGKPQGSIGGRNITMDWDISQTGIYVAVNYIGLLDELAIFNRPLDDDEIQRLAAEPDALSGLKR